MRIAVTHDCGDDYGDDDYSDDYSDDYGDSLLFTPQAAALAAWVSRSHSGVGAIL
jgi:hypothetical protein